MTAIEKHGFAHHAALVERMAGTLGVDLSRAIEGGDISFDGVDDAVHSCMGCPDPEGCAIWLGDHTEGANAAPEICQNRVLFKQLG